MKLDFQPVIIIGEVNAVTDGNNPYTGIPQIFQFYQTAAVAAGKTGEILDDENVILMGHQPVPHGLVALALLKGVAGAVPVLIEGEGTAGEFLLYKVLNDRFLVFNGYVVPVQFIVYRNTAVACNIKCFNHGFPPPFR